MSEHSLEDYMQMNEKTLMALMAYKVDQVCSKELPAIVKHLEKINGTLQDHDRRILAQEIAANILDKEREREHNTCEPVSISKKQKMSYGGIAVAIALGVYSLIQLLV